MRKATHMDPARDDTLKKYEELLVMALRVRKVPGERIGQILAEVQAHVAESGEDPHVAFGPPQQYAQQFDGAAGRGREPVIDPRTGTEIHPLPRWVPVLMAATFVLVLALFWIFR